MGKKVLCWDLDETLGGFRNLDPELKELRLPWGYRYGIHETLGRLSAEGFEHVIATSAAESYAKRLLEICGLTDFFAAIFDKAVMSRYYWGKTYRPIANHFGLSEQAALDGMMVIGDRSSDKPIDINIVFLEHENGYQYDAVLIERIIGVLSSAGEGSFQRGFEAMYQNAEEIKERYSTHRVYRVDDALEVLPEYRTKERDMNVGEEEIPTLEVSKAEGLRREPVHFEIPPDLRV